MVDLLLLLLCFWWECSWLMRLSVRLSVGVSLGVLGAEVLRFECGTRRATELKMLP